MLIVALWWVSQAAPPAPHVELVCPVQQVIDCHAVAEKIQLYGSEYPVQWIDAGSEAALEGPSEQAVFRVILRVLPHARCAIEVFDLTEAEARARTSEIDCSAGEGQERRIAMHVKTDLDSDYARALAAFLAQPRRRRTPLAPAIAQNPPASAPADEAPRRPLQTLSPPPADDTAPPARRWRYGLVAFGGASGIGQLPLGSAGMGLEIRSPFGPGGEVGVRGDFRPTLATNAGAVSAAFLSAYLRLVWRFAPLPALHLEVGAHAELQVAFVRLEGALGTYFISGGAGPTGRLIFPLVGERLALFVDARTLAGFNRVELRSAGKPLTQWLPLLWGASAGVEVTF